MAHAADGERHAIRGYMWQYDQLAARVYDSLLDGSFVELRLVDPRVGKVDDLMLLTTTGSAGHQYKSQEYAGSLSLGELLVSGRTAGGKSTPSLLRELADGWVVLDQEPGTASVHLVTNRWASTADRLGTQDDPDRPSPDHFAAFLAHVAEPLRTGELKLEDVPAGWRPALRRIQVASSLDDEAFGRFVGALHIEVGQPDPLQTTDVVRRGDISELSDALFRKVGQAREVVTLKRDEVLALVGWTDRTRLRSAHEFTVDLDTYEPLNPAIDALEELLNSTTHGYIALVGPPGSGKSTLLSQVLTGTSRRLVRYYAYVPRGGPNRNRLEAQGFLHDLVLMLDRELGTSRGHLLDTSIPALRATLVDQLDKAAGDYSETGVRTIVVVDGLDHVERDHPGLDNLLGELPQPETLGDGIVFVVGTRTLSPLQPSTREHVEQGRIVDLGDHRLGHDAVITICRRAAATAKLGAEVHERIAELTAGHPLSLGYLINKMAVLDDTDEALTALSGAVVYDGDIAGQYRAIWDGLDSYAQELLAIVTRLRVHFTYGDLVDWFGQVPARTFRCDLAYLFRATGTSWTVFHDSFRQYVANNSNLDNALPPTDPLWDARYHAQIADLCARASRPLVRWEELYHRHRAGQDISAYASQVRFREQLLGLRSPEAIRDDIAIALHDAANRRGLVDFVAVLLAKVEFDSRLNALEEVDPSW